MHVVCTCVIPHIRFVCLGGVKLSRVITPPYVFSVLAQDRCVGIHIVCMCPSIVNACTVSD